MKDKENAKNLFECVIEMIKDWGLDFNNCRGQGYDGAAVMAGEKSGLRTRLQELNKHAIYIHCNAHNLNLVMSAVCEGNESSKKFSTTLSGLYSFVMNARNRLYALWSHCDRNDCRVRTLKKLCETRWSARYNSVRAVKEMFEEILATLEWVEGNDADDGADAALGYIKEMQSKDFIFMLIVWEEILRKCNALSKQLQTVNMDMIEAIDLISLTKGALQIMRSDDAFNNRYEAAKDFSESNDVEFEENHEAARRVRRRKKFFDDPEGAEEVVLTDSDK